MCRFLAIHATSPLEPHPWVEAFAPVCRASPEYQGHGWGVAVHQESGWQRYRSARPIWEEVELATSPPGATARQLPTSRVLLVHARSAFRNEGITEENAMPFISDDLAFAFNGELRAVRLAVAGATGAHRLLNLLDRFRAAALRNPVGSQDPAQEPPNPLGSALHRLYDVVVARSHSVRGMNVVASDGDGIWVGTLATEDLTYFTVHHLRVRMGDGPEAVVVASEPVPLPAGVHPLGADWQPVPSPLVTRLRAVDPC